MTNFAIQQDRADRDPAVPARSAVNVGAIPGTRGGALNGAVVGCVAAGQAKGHYCYR